MVATVAKVAEKEPDGLLAFLVWPGALLSGRPAQTGFRWFGRLHAALSFAIPGQVGIASGLFGYGACRIVRQSDVPASFAAVDSRMGSVTAGFSQWGPLSTLYARHFPSSSRKADYFHLT